MQRQKSILSFFQKPTAPEIRGTDTPPEKLPPRPPLLRSAITSHAPFAFSTVMHKFAREPKQSNQNLQDEEFSRGRPRACVSRLGDCSSGVVEPKILDFSNVDDQDCVPGPETPLMQPIVPGLKRIKEESHGGVGVDNHGFPLLTESSKRMKLLRGPGTVDEGGKRASDESSEAGSSKFEWLNPSSIRDASRRRPGDPLYDRRKLYVPPDALSKMTATQRQYWDVKRWYMDVVLFFKVGKFYELYELDAEIGRKELDWKMTHSGVGKCRQVGISESGIDDAVQKLIARGYKVGRMEQMESSDQAKARGATSVIQRKLFHVSTPSTTTTDDSIRPDAVHLLALNEVFCCTVALVHILRVF